MTDWVKEAQEKWEQVRRLSEEVAAGLDDGWSLKYYDTREYSGRSPDIVHTDGRSFDLRIGDYGQDQGKVAVRPNWPTRPGDGHACMSPHDLYSPREESPSINVSISRGVPVIVREIERRFLPEYTRIRQRLVDKLAAEIEWKSKQEAAFARIKEAVPTLREVNDPCAGSYYPQNGSNGGYGTVKVNSGESVDIEFHSLSPEKALEALKVLCG